MSSLLSTPRWIVSLSLVANGGTFVSQLSFSQPQQPWSDVFYFFQVFVLSPQSLLFSSIQNAGKAQ